MRKFFSMVLVIILLVFIVPGIVDSYAERQHPVKPDRWTLYTVQKGDCIWKIADKFLPNVPYWVAVQWILEDNGMNKAEIIYPGDRLNIPCENGEMTEPYGQD